MSEAHGETFALGQRGFGLAGRSGPARVLAQRLASFSPQSARGADPLRIARFSGAATNELDLSALAPQIPQEEGADSAPSAVVHHAAAEWSPLAPTALAAEPAERAALVQSQHDRIPAREHFVESVPSSQPLPSDVHQTWAVPRHANAVSEEVFALAPTPRAPGREQATTALSASAPVPGNSITEPTRINAEVAVPVQRPPAAKTLAPVSASNATTPAAPTLAREVQQVAPRAEPHAPSDRPQMAVPIAPALQKQSAMAPAPELAAAAGEGGSQLPAPASRRQPPVAAQPMGHSEVPGVSARPQLPPAALEPRLLERLAEAARQPSQEAVVRIGSVSVVMRPPAPAPAPQYMAPPPPAPSAPMRSMHSNPWLSRGRGGD